jgi:hypothetical protein
MEILPALLVNLAVPKVAIAEHVEHRNKNSAKDNLARDGSDDVALLRCRQDVGEDALHNAAEVLFDGRNVGLGTEVVVG